MASSCADAERGFKGSLIPDAADIASFQAAIEIAWVLIVEKEVFLVYLLSG